MRYAFVLLFFNLIGGAGCQILVAQVKPAGSSRWGYVNIEGKMITPPEFKHCTAFDEDGYALVSTKGLRRARVIKSDGTTVMGDGQRLRLVTTMENGRFNSGLGIVKDNGKVGYIGHDGKLKFPLQYDPALDFNDGYAAAEKDGAWYLLTCQGGERRIEIPDLYKITHCSDSLVVYAANSLLGVLDVDLNVLITASFANIGSFSNGLAYARKPGGFVGFIDKHGNWVVNPKYDEVHVFDSTSGLALVYHKKEEFYIDRNGNEIRIADADDLHYFHEGLAGAKRNKHVGFVDRTGKWVIPPQFKRVRGFKNGYAAVRLKRRWGVIDTEGRWVLQPQYKRLKDFTLVTR